MVKTQYETILALDPRNTFVHYKPGLLYYYQKNYEQALPHFQEVVNLYPFDDDGLLMLA